MKGKFEFYYDGAGYNKFDLVHEILQRFVKQQNFTRVEEVNQTLASVKKLPVLVARPDTNDKHNLSCPVILNGATESFIIETWSNTHIGLFLKFCFLQNFKVMTMAEAEEYMLKKYGEISWSRLSWRTDIQWTEELIECFGHKWDNLPIRNDEKLLERYEDKLYWPHVTAIFSPWTEPLLDKYADKLDWDFLSRKLPWTEELLDKYVDKLDWSSNLFALSSNTEIDWTEKLLEKYKDKHNWRELIYNKSINWTKELIEKYQDYIDWSFLSSSDYVELN